jgi:hypothetical protein
MAKKKLVRSNAATGAYRNEQRRRSDEVGLHTGIKANTDTAIKLAAKRKGVDVPKDNTKAETTKIENRGKAKTAGRPVSKPKKKLAGQLRDIEKKRKIKAPKKKTTKNKKRKT